MPFEVVESSGRQEKEHDGSEEQLEGAFLQEGIIEAGENEEERRVAESEARRKVEEVFHHASEETVKREQELDVLRAWDELRKIDQDLQPIVRELTHASLRRGIFRCLNILDFPINRSRRRERNNLINSREPHLQVLKKEVEQFSINAEEFFQAVADSDFSNFCKRLRQNITRMQELERASPGSVERLCRDYGIYCFSRYPEKMLLQQLEQEEDTQTPYGIIMHSRADWNGSFYDRRPISSLDENAERIGLNVRIFECGSLFEAAKHLIRLNRRYGPSQKIQFAYVAGHGNERAIEIGKSRLSANQLPKEGLKEIASFFVSQPTLIVNSCLTAKEDLGIAALLAEATGAETIASEVTSRGAYIKKIEKIGDRYQFEVFFQKDSKIGEKGPSVKVIEPRIFKS